MSGRAAGTFAQLVEQARDPASSLDERHAAFTRLVQRSQHVVFAVALASLRDVEDARDAAQDAFATAWHRLRQLRDPSAFPAWLRAIVVTECARRRRRGGPPRELAFVTAHVEPVSDRLHYQCLIASALAGLPEHERHVLVLYYFLGHTLPQIARMLRLKPGTVGKRLHSARLRIRRGLPRSVRSDFVRLSPSESFVERVRRGLLDEYVGQYRFERRPDHVVTITREGGSLISTASGQRHLLVSGGRRSLVASHYDGEARFCCDRSGAITHFVYYEFGQRLGVARKINTS